MSIHRAKTAEQGWRGGTLQAAGTAWVGVSRPRYKPLGLLPTWRWLGMGGRAIAAALCLKVGCRPVARVNCLRFIRHSGTSQRLSAPVVGARHGLAPKASDGGRPGGEGPARQAGSVRARSVSSARRISCPAQGPDPSAPSRPGYWHRPRPALGSEPAATGNFAPGRYKPLGEAGRPVAHRRDGHPQTSAALPQANPQPRTTFPQLFRHHSLNSPSWIESNLPDRWARRPLNSWVLRRFKEPIPWHASCFPTFKSHRTPG